MATPLDFDHASRRETNDNPDFMASAPSGGTNRRQLLSYILRLLGRGYDLHGARPADYANSVRELRPYRGLEGNQHG